MNQLILSSFVGKQTLEGHEERFSRSEKGDKQKRHRYIDNACGAR
jgi:hypothetical protein